MADKWNSWQANDLFASAIPQLLQKWDSGQGAQPSVGLGLPVGMVGGVAGNNLLSGALDAAKLPGDVYQGNVDLNSPAGFARAQNMAGMLMGSGMPMAEAGAVGSAGGRLFHGSPQTGLTELVPSSRGPMGPGVYATPAEQIAGHYAHGGPVYQIPNENLDIYRGVGHRSDAEYLGWKDDKQRLMNAVEPSKRDEVLPLIDKMWSSDGYPLYQRLLRIYGSEEATQNLFKRAGFEGLSGLVDGPETLIFGNVPISP